MQENFQTLADESNENDARIEATESAIDFVSSCNSGDEVIGLSGGQIHCRGPITSYLSIPAVAFTPENSSQGWIGNSSGTARNFGSRRMFAPVFLPHRAVVTGFFCGGYDAQNINAIRWILRRNSPQVANVDMAVIQTSFFDTGFLRGFTSVINSAEVSNQSYNYYVVAETTSGNCGDCTVAFCRITYRE